MLTPLQIKKLSHFFNILDFDKNGSIEADDFEAIGENLAIIRDIDLDTPEYEVVMAMTNGIWDKLVPYVENGEGTQQQWLQFMTVLLDPKNLETYKQYLNNFVTTIFKMFDINDDGYISQTEYIDLFIGMRIEVRFAPKAFRNLDTNQDGRLSKEEMIISVDQFMRSDNPNASGNWLFGGWEESKV